MGHQQMTEKIKQIIDRWAQEARNPRNDGYTQEGYRGYIEEVRDYAAQELGKKSGKQSKDDSGNQWWKSTSKLGAPEQKT